jgi:mono/diheme cytochrome c family protein
MRGSVGLLLLGICGMVSPPSAVPAAAQFHQSTGATIYRTACASCHGPDGRGAPRTTVGFETPLPDFTDCSFSTPEADADWFAVVHEGGPARAFDRMMPSFGDALTRDDIVRVVDHVRSFCTEQGWPRGDLNLPRPLVTEKAFPENEAVLTTSIQNGETAAFGNEFLYERRVGRRGQYEIAVPVDLIKSDSGEWQRGLGDVAAAYKHVLYDSLPRGSILSAGGELVLPTGKETEGLGGGTTMVEPFATFSQILPRDAFMHLHGGFGVPVGNSSADAESFWRVALGKTFVERRWHRAWSPMVELVGARELAAGARALWDTVPQIQISLSTRQHVLLNVGVRVPLNQRQERSATVMTYLLWDWFDGGFFDGWR